MPPKRKNRNRQLGLNVPGVGDLLGLVLNENGYDAQMAENARERDRFYYMGMQMNHADRQERHHREYMQHQDHADRQDRLHREYMQHQANGWYTFIGFLVIVVLAFIVLSQNKAMYSI